MSFNHLQLIEPVLKALYHEGYITPTPVQEKAIPYILDKKDLLCCAQTGTGKTAAFVLPLLQLLHQQQADAASANQPVIKALILTPTRELAIQIGESIGAYGRFLNLKHHVVYGGVSQRSQVQAIRQGLDIIVATPGRLLDLLQQRVLSLRHIRYFVLDEADRMLDMGFIVDVKKILTKIPTQRQTLFFSATMPGSIRQLADALLTRPVCVQVTPVSSAVDIIEQFVYFTKAMNKQSLLLHLLKDESLKSVLIFIQMKHAADRLTHQLLKAGIRAEAIHSNKSQQARQRSLSHFKAGKSRVLVATDIAARGIDIDELSHVINFDLPNVPETYVHRIGRTGRAGTAGTAISFCDWSEKIFLKDIQKLIRKTIPAVKDHPFDIPSLHDIPGLTMTGNAGSRFRKGGGGRKYGKTFSQQAL